MLVSDSTDSRPLLRHSQSQSSLLRSHHFYDNSHLVFVLRCLLSLAITSVSLLVVWSAFVDTYWAGEGAILGAEGLVQNFRPQGC